MRTTSSYKRLSRALLPLLSVVFLITLLILLRRFYLSTTVIVPDTGGTYIEGSVGEMKPLIPWFTVTNDVNRDIVSLVFSGLLKYDPVTKRIKDDLATVLVADQGRIYNVKLKEDLYWHDHTPENPHPVTADDVVFTYQSIQNPDFPNPILRQNFQGVEIRKVDNRTVQFKLQDPYSFFPSNLTLGLIPQRSFEGIPVGKFDQVLDFGFNPIGAGPYKFKSLVQTEVSTEMTLERFDRPIPPDYRLEQIIFRIFPDYSALLSDIANLDGVRLVPTNDSGDYMIPNRFTAKSYSLPQYVALFFNMDRAVLEDDNLRLGLQLGTDKEALVDVVGQADIVDTPLLELEKDDWRYSYDPDAAQGAFFESNWHLPEKVRLQRLLEIHEANSVGVLQIDPIVLLDTGAILTVTGSYLEAESGSTLNGIPVEPHPTSSGTWIAPLPAHGGTGSLALGMNQVRLLDPDGRPIDTFYVWRTAKPNDYRLAAQEQELKDLFIASRGDSLPEEERITVQDLYLQKGYLRRRTSADPQDIRVNDVGDRLTLTLLTSPSPPQYAELADAIKKQWAALGVHVAITVPETRKAFEEEMLARNYDVLLFGQSLLDNLDAYPYWHSAGIQTTRGNSKFGLKIDAYNLSQYSSLAADGLLEVIRGTSDDQERQDALTKLQETLQDDLPAIFLYSPRYAFAHHEQLQGVEFGALSLHSDRFLTLHDWYLKEERVFKPNLGWWSFFSWLVGAV